MDELKKQVRKQLRQIIAQIPDKERIEKSRLICDYVIKSDEFKKASVLMFFLSLPQEVDTAPMILKAWQQGKTVAVPKISWEPHHMIPVEITSLETGLSVDKMGLRTPTTANPIAPEEIDLVIAPGLGFDRQGNRLGRGGSFYDGFLSQPKIKAQKMAVAFSVQILDSIPYDKKDVPMDALVCESGILRF